MGTYAKGTSVAPERTQVEIQSTLRRYGADRFGVMESKESAGVGFEIGGLTIRIECPLPDASASEFTRTEMGRDRSETAAYRAFEQAIRQRWRALLLAIRAKLEAVDSGISTMEREFMPFVVMPDGRTLGDHLIPKLEAYAATGKMPKLLEAL